MKAAITTDAELIAQYDQTGDEEAFRQLFHRHRDFAYRTAVLCVKDTAGADDIVQAAFFQVMRLAERFHSKGSFRAWFRMIIQNVSNNYICGLRKRRIREQRVGQNRFRGELRWERERSDRADWLEVLENEIGQLSEREQYLLRLRFGQNLTLDQTAEILNVKKGKVRNQISAVLEQLRRRMTYLDH